MASNLNIPHSAKPFVAAIGLGEHITVRQMAVLHIVAGNPGHSTGEIARALNLSKPSVTRAMDTLKQLGLADRRPDPTDARKVRCVPTNAGRAAAGGAK